MPQQIHRGKREIGGARRFFPSVRKALVQCAVQKTGGKFRGGLPETKFIQHRFKEATVRLLCPESKRPAVLYAAGKQIGTAGALGKHHIENTAIFSADSVMVCGCHKKKHSCRDRVTYPVNFIIARTLYHIFQLVKFVPMKRLTDYPYPSAELKKAWENLLFNQFHDILAGCAIESAYRDAANLFGETMSVTERELNLAMQAIAKKVETARGGNLGGAVKKHFLVWEHEKLGTPVLVFNPHAFPVRAAVRRRAECARMTDETGREIPFQMIRGEATNGKSDIYELTFQAEVPAMGYRLYRVFVSGEAERGETVFADEHTLENAVLRVEFDRGSGEITKIISKTNGAVIADGGFDAVLTDETACDTWAHGQFDLGEVCGRFSAPEFEVLESGAVCAALRVTVHHEVCTLTREYWLYAGSDELRVSLTADFHGKHRALKLCFPAKDEVTCEIPFGTVTRSLCQGEEPFGKWFASAGVGVANIGKYGYDSTADSVRMTVLRGAAFADHYGVRDGRLHYMSQGIHHTEYTVFPFSSATDAHRRAALLNSPLKAINAGFHHGTLPERYGAVSGVPENVFVSAIKKNEDGNGAILRAYECEGKTAHGAVTLFDRKIPLSLTPYSIETVNEQGERLNFMEWKL